MEPLRNATLKLISSPFANLKQFKNGCCSALVRFFFSCCCNRRERQARDELFDHFMEQLDVEHMIRQSLCLSDFFRSYLTNEQKVMLSLQRNRFPGGNSSSEENDDDDDGGNKIDSEQLAKQLMDFTPRSTFDKRLLLGVMYRRGVPPKLQEAEHEDHDDHELGVAIPLQFPISNKSPVNLD